MRRSLHPLAFALLAFSLTCGGESVAPRAVASIALTSPIGNRLAVGRTVQLAVEARDANGAVMPGVSFTFTSSTATVAQVTGAGLVSGLASGAVTVTATAATTSVTQTIALQVIAADLAAIDALPNDALATALVNNLTAAVRTRVQAALQLCDAGTTTGNFGQVEACVAAVRVEANAAGDATDRALLASLNLFTDHMLRLLNP